MRRGGDVTVEHDLDHRSADLLDHPDADLAAVRRREECERQDVGRARDRETRPEIGKHRHAGGVLHQLPIGVGVALEPMPMQLTTAESVRVVASAAVDP